ncbi:MAG TPA: hypothetical protein VH723_02390 [Candidatus Limnocylindrales bacterium]|jgi:hypothetical protein
MDARSKGSGRPGGQRPQPAEDLAADLVRFSAAMVTLLAAVALGLFI